MPSAIRKSQNESGYVLLSIMLLMTLMLIALTIEAPRVAQQIKREKEEELIHRGNEYKAAVKKFFRKFGRYPLSIDELQSTNNMRFLRKRYTDPFTGKDDWRLLHVGEVQVNPVTGGTTANGQPIGQQIGQQIGQPIGTGINQPGPSGMSFGQSSTITSNQPATGIGAAGATTSSVAGQGTGQETTTSGTPGTSGFSSPFGNSNGQFGGGPIIGVSSVSKLKSIKEINGKDHYNDWQFVYDPRLEIQNQPLNSPGINGANPIGGTTPGLNPTNLNPTGNPGSNVPQSMQQQ
jgi:type II secretory pathway pseudopilin PulG